VSLLEDRRSYILRSYGHDVPCRFVNVESVKVLRGLGVASSKTRSQILQILNDSQNGPSMELLEESEVFLWGESAVAAVALDHDDSAVYKFFDALMDVDDFYRGRYLCYFTGEVLKVSPTTLIRCDKGAEIVGSLLQDRGGRGSGTYWTVVSKWPRASEVFKPQISAYLQDGYSESHAYCFPLVCRIANENGLALDEAAAIVKYAVQSPTDSPKIHSTFIEFSHDGEAAEMLHAALSIMMGEGDNDALELRRALELTEVLQPDTGHRNNWDTALCR
jgi:hypothetical protein